MPVIGLDHVQLAMPAGREAEARAFYSGLLGIPEIEKPPALAARGGAWFERGRIKLHLGVDPEFRAARKAHAGLLVTGLDALIEKLRRAGHDVVDDERLPRADSLARIWPECRARSFLPTRRRRISRR